MAGDEKHRRTWLPGEFGSISLRITATAIAVAVVAAATLLSFYLPRWREPIRFVGGGLGIAAGVLAAYYGTKSLEATINQQRISRAFVYVDGWDSADFSQSRQAGRAILDSIKPLGQDKIEELLLDAGKRTVIIDVLNFLRGNGLGSKSRQC